MNCVDLKILFDALIELGDLDVQRKLWLPGGQEMSSFADAVERMFTDSGLGSAIDLGGVVFSAEIDHDIILLRKLLSQIDRNHGPQRLIYDKSMPLIREKAISIFNEIKKQ